MIVFSGYQNTTKSMTAQHKSIFKRKFTPVSKTFKVDVKWGYTICIETICNTYPLENSRWEKHHLRTLKTIKFICTSFFLWHKFCLQILSLVLSQKTNLAHVICSRNALRHVHYIWILQQLVRNRSSYKLKFMFSDTNTLHQSDVINVIS